ncbi:MAG: hypothetical protein L0332_10335 [Chloroflexi bacterium]|nr:hypothetical protein [Chloroflexota bacterium]MCI0576064.1 hypothetical protein [Chloroflexota bacterium]MCI0647852.1 hypothetical protein [Chloroflexota bacterium]MCI0727103.1 hypothetical protein [Chloroflexota bacterium]
MCLLIVEILLFIAGILALITGKLPDKLFKLLFGKGEYHVEPPRARLFGLLLASPLPIAFTAGVILGLLFGQEGAGYASYLEFIILIAVCIAAIIIARRLRQKPVSSLDNVTQ